MKVIIIGGFLGSGKTTLLLQLAPFLAEGIHRNPAVVIVENEISPTDIDSSFLLDHGMDVRTLSAGCVCCTSTASLLDTVQEIRSAYNPAYLIIEATGIAYPDSIAETLHNNGEKDITVIALADAKRWDKVSHAMPQFIQSQLSSAHIVFLNKTDLVPAEKVFKIRSAISRIAPDAVIHPVCALNGNLEEYFTSIKQEVLWQEH